jgi:hypothetical protein
VGGEIKADIFSEGQIVDVQGVTKGKGFQGTIKRWNFRMGDATHGNSLSHRSPGSIGQRQTPGRVFPGKKMSGHMGDVTQTTQNLQVVKVDAERGLIAVRGAVPGAPGGDVIVRPASKVKESDHGTQYQVAPAPCRSPTPCSAANSARTWSTRSWLPTATPVVPAPRRRRPRSEVNGTTKKSRSRRAAVRVTAR